ncbi:hypothetical protein CSA56_11440 [candidate division KSB3 bacterium]|uniref:Uncharacterized protein n=1 Tax=candidate division KSB3 bacterium TaxID=2044937 RepID=A0A2G6KF01_9BACT|nr:MAG: hypothetical protein CSA56_11440 [candidate division KSB3 bacterium]
MRRYCICRNIFIPLCLCCIIIFGWCEHSQGATQEDTALRAIQDQIITLRKEFKLQMQQAGSDRQAIYENIQLKLKEITEAQNTSKKIQPELMAQVEQLLPTLETYGKQIDKFEQMVAAIEAGTHETLDSIEAQLATIKQQGIRKTNRSQYTAIGSDSEPVIDSGEEPGRDVGSEDPTRPSPLDLAPGKLFRLAYGFFRQGEYDVAIGGFQKFLIDFPKSELAGAAQYWIAESFNRLEEYDLAIQEYSLLIQTYPRDAKIGDAQYGIGMALLKLGRADEARQKFQYVADHFGGTIAGQKAQKRLGEF